MSEFNEWFCALPEGRQKVLREDKWALAASAFEAGKAERDALAAQVDALNSKNFKLTCYRVDVLRCLKTIAFEHNHADVPLYQPMARQLMDSISANAELKEVRAEAVIKFAEHVFTGTDCLHVNLKAAANQYAASILAGKE